MPGDIQRSCVVTGGGRGVGKAIVERLSREHHVVVIELDAGNLGWISNHPHAARLTALVGDAADEAVTERAADLAREAGVFTGWVNNSAVFQDASVHSISAAEIWKLIELNALPALTGCTTAVKCFLTMGTGGAIVNVSSHQAQRPVPGALPYVAAKAMLEGLTRALAVEYGPRGIRVNTVALGSISTERYEQYLAAQSPDQAADLQRELARLHPLGRVGQAQEVGSVVNYLLSDDSSFITGATIPVDGGRAVLGHDPEARPL
jgi:NAD(P)-dependent dehydrogenase (short-subunit alcohol dehydrogenase family)